MRCRILPPSIINKEKLPLVCAETDVDNDNAETADVDDRRACSDDDVSTLESGLLVADDFGVGRNSYAQKA